MLEIILPNCLHFQFFTCTDLKDPVVPQNLVSFSDPVMDTYRLPTEMAQEHVNLLFSFLILLVKQLMKDPLNHRVRGCTLHSQALSCSPAVHVITCHRGVKKVVQIGDLFPLQREQPLRWYPRLLPT